MLFVALRYIKALISCSRTPLSEKHGGNDLTIYG